MKVYTCPVCGKTFIPHPGWLYKLSINRRVLTLCNYNCYRKVEADEEANKSKRRNTEL